MIQDRGLFSGTLEWCQQGGAWSTNTLQINNIGQLTIAYGPQYALTANNQLHLGNQRILNLAEAPTTPYSDVIIKNLHSSAVTFSVQNGIPTLHVTSVGNEQCSFRSPDNAEEPFLRFLAALMVWQNMNVYGIHNKYFNIPLPLQGPENHDKKISTSQSVLIYDESDDNNVIVINREEKNLLVCRFKVFGPLSKSQKKNYNIPGPKNPLYPSDSTVYEGWFYAMGVIKSNGMLDLLSEQDGTLLYSVNIAVLLRSEIRQVHHLLFESLNVLFVGVIPSLRASCTNSNVCPPSQKPSFFIPSPSSKFSELRYATSQRLLLSFPLHIDLEDWFVALLLLAAGEYVGVNAQYLARTALKVTRKLKVDVLEASFEEPVDYDDEGYAVASNLYADIILWDLVWARTSIVETEKYPFWREEFDFSLPVLTNTLDIAVHKVPRKKSALLGRKKKSEEQETLVGTAIVSEDVVENSGGKEVWIPINSTTGEKIGQLCVRVLLLEHHLLLPSNFDLLQKMLLGAPLEDLITFLGTGEIAARYEELEEVAHMMLDVFQAAHREELWFEALMDYELRTMDTGKASANFFNTLFRGNSILTKTLERYNLRVGQEFLEKVVGEFVLQVAEDDYDCEVDPARIDVKDIEEKESIIDENFMRLYDYVEQIWDKIYRLCNDLPAPIRRGLEIFRIKLEQSSLFEDDPEMSTGLALNCVTGFLFLRLICPAILNPKLFFLIKDHQTGKIKRTLTLVSKILLTLSNRARFGAKEPWLIKMNYFLEQHEGELLRYLDIVTNRVSSDQEKILDLSDTVVRPDISISPQISNELPTNPFLIDKCLRLTQLAGILAKDLVNKDDEFTFSKRHLYRVGSLRFEEQVKSNNLAYASEEMLRSLSSPRRGLNKPQVLFSDLQQECYVLLQRVAALDHLLTLFENPVLVQSWESFSERVVSGAVVDNRKRLLYVRRFLNNGELAIIEDPNMKRVEDILSLFKIKFSSSSIPSTPTKLAPPRFGKLIKSASSNTLGEESPFRKSFWRRR